MTLSSTSDSVEERIAKKLSSVGPMEEMVKFVTLFREEFTRIVGNEVVANLEGVQDFIRTELVDNTSIYWLSRAMTFLCEDLVPILSQFHDAIHTDIIDRIRELNMYLKSNHLIMLTLSALMIPLDKKDKSTLPIPLSKMYGLLVPLDFSNKYGLNVRQHFLYHIRFEYLTWFHVVSDFIV
jgi:hypothetical protein